MPSERTYWSSCADWIDCVRQYSGATGYRGMRRPREQWKWAAVLFLIWNFVRISVHISVMDSLHSQSTWLFNVFDHSSHVHGRAVIAVAIFHDVATSWQRVPCRDIVKQFFPQSFITIRPTTCTVYWYIDSMLVHSNSPLTTIDGSVSRL